MSSFSPQTEKNSGIQIKETYYALSWHWNNRLIDGNSIWMWIFENWVITLQKKKIADCIFPIPQHILWMRVKYYVLYLSDATCIMDRFCCYCIPRDITNILLHSNALIVTMHNIREFHRRHNIPTYIMHMFYIWIVTLRNSCSCRLKLLFL